MGRFAVFGLPVVLLVAACGGASSTELFTEPSAIGDAPATEPAEGDAEAPADEPDQPPSPDATTLSDAPDAEADAGSFERCSADSECEEPALCNWKIDRCAPPGPIGAPCKRDSECTGGLCNWELETCATKAPSGTACGRNKECASGACSASGTCK